MVAVHVIYMHYAYDYYKVGEPKARGHRAYTQSICSHFRGAYKGLQPVNLSSRKNCMHSPASVEHPSVTDASGLPATQHPPLGGDVEGHPVSCRKTQNGQTSKHQALMIRVIVKTQASKAIQY